MFNNALVPAGLGGSPISLVTLLVGNKCSQSTDPFCDSQPPCSCDTFCAGSCAINATGRENKTLYRMTMNGVDGITSKNTGDAAGDTSFVISMRTQAFGCLKTPGSPACKAVAQFHGDSPDNTDVITEVVVEFDGNWGPYRYCNPLNVSDPLRGGWHCAAAIDLSPPNLTATCKANFSTIGGYAFTHMKGELLQGVTTEECCAAALHAATSAGLPFWTWFPNGTCAVGTPTSGAAVPLNGAALGYDRKYAPTHCDCPRAQAQAGRENLTAVFSGASAGALAKYPVGGEWYSTPAAGECAPGHAAGDSSGCAWRLVQTTKIINASCMYRTLEAAVEALAPACFAACPQPSNATSACFLSCFNTAVTHATMAQLLAPWSAAFAGACPLCADVTCKSPVVEEIIT